MANFNDEISADKPVESPGLALRKPEARSRVTNGKDVLPGVDGRSMIARRYHDVCAAVAADQGGAERISEARMQLIRRFAAAACLAEDWRPAWPPVKSSTFANMPCCVARLVRLGHRIGIDRIPQDIGTISLADYVNSPPDEPQEARACRRRNSILSVP